MATVPSFQLDPLPLPLDLFSGDRQIIILPLEEKRRNSKKKKTGMLAMFDLGSVS